MKADIEDYMYGRFCPRCHEALDAEDKEGTYCPECGAQMTYDPSGAPVPLIPLRRKNVANICGVS